MVNVYVVERKTTSEDLGLGGTYWKRLNIDSQISIYSAAVQQLGFDVRGILYDCLRKPAQRPSQAKAETPDAYGRRVLEAITESPERYYQRGVIMRLASELDEAKADVWQTAVALRDARRLKVFPRNPDSCVQWSRACDYLAVCCGEASIDDPVLFRKQEKKHIELDVTIGNDRPGRDGTIADGKGRAGLELITQSSLRTFRSCARKYFFRYELQMRPLAPEAEPLRQGKSIHKALEVWSTSGGDLEKSLAFLDKEDLYKYAKEAAMVTGYHARWPLPTGVIAVEKEWQMDLVNPETGAASRTFRLGGRVDALVEA
jgi:hypothetical protein